MVTAEASPVALGAILFKLFFIIVSACLSWQLRYLDACLLHLMGDLILLIADLFVRLLFAHWNILLLHANLIEGDPMRTSDPRPRVLRDANRDIT